uniref:DNA repair metallo-beta-lactamase domain-containing protein n=1 Tax=Ananas comosus var. bracteatus TaxID=296719 RepID=A0A6V7PF27_ANACO|nr:unnamed protein product [Ananas comosus var. bracteatus]
MMGKKTLLEALQGDKVDALYLDNTYCHPSFAFPPREVVAEQVVDIITRHPNHDVIIGIDTLGKKIYCYISHRPLEQRFGCGQSGGRVAIMRKERRGAKIAETDALCTSKLNVKIG